MFEARMGGRAVALLLVGYVLAAPASARPADWNAELRAAHKALAAGDHAGAYALYLRAAPRNPLAQFSLGLFLQQGWGRAKDAAGACVWFERAARRHIPAAEHAWGDCLAQGIGRAVNVPEALPWYERAAEHGHLISWCAGADYYVQGKGVAQDVGRGLTQCAKAAQANSPPAMLKLADFFHHSDFVPRDFAAARHWYRQAAERRVSEAQFRLGLMLVAGEGGEADSGEGLFWLETAASEGYAPAYLPTALLYANAPVEAETGTVAPAYLAKTYLWTMAAKARAPEAAQRHEAQVLEAAVLKLMPAGWRADLDKRVAAHLEKYPP